MNDGLAVLLAAARKRRFEDQPGFNPQTMGNRRSGRQAGPAGPIGPPPTPRQFAAAHDRPSPQPQYDSGVRRGHAFTQGPLAGFEGDSRNRRRKS